VPWAPTDPHIIGNRIGEVFLRHFDEGVARSLGGTVVTMTPARAAGMGIDLARTPVVPSGGACYTVVVPGLGQAASPLEVLVHITNPETSLRDYIIPSYVIKRGSPTLAMDRFEVGKLSFRVPASGSTPSGVGYSAYAERDAPYQWDIPYSIQGHARNQGQGAIMFRFMLRKFHPLGAISVWDSLGMERGYDFVLEGVEDLTNLVSLAKRDVAFGASIRVLGEFDLHPEREERSVWGEVLTFDQGVQPS
jgi:hypothetical protein